MSESKPLPTGLVTFLFTDIQGSTPLWEQVPEAMKVSDALHRALLTRAIVECDGCVVRLIGDSFLASFSQSSQALNSALQAQRLLQAGSWNETGPIRVRMGLHSGWVELDENGEYVNSHNFNRAARVMSVAHGGQVLLSQEVVDLLAGYLPDQVTLKDLGEHRLKGMLKLEHLYQVVSPDLPQDFPPLSTGVMPPNNLPALASSFIGRQAEMAEVENLLDLEQPGHRRLVTLFGPGGTGKTRLSLQIGHDLVGCFPGGVWFIELAGLTNPDLVAQSVVSALGLQMTVHQTALAGLDDYFREKTALLILDNCEHLVEACARLSDGLLRACPRLHILASSREILGISGEYIFPVPPLGLPSLDHPTPQGLLASEAGCLFYERARAVRPGFDVTPQNAPAIAQICRHLDGIPLAIELAATRIRSLTVEQIAAHLDDRFRLLTGGSRTVLPRHQTLKALVDWSWDLLTPAEQVMLRRLSVFAGSWTLEAAQALGDDLFETLDLLYQLINKSLVILDEPPGSPGRYRMLETIRQYSLGKLFIAGEDQAMRTRHRDWFLDLAEEAAPRLKSQAQVDWSNRLECEHDNLRLAFEWAYEQGDDVAALRLASALHYFWWIRGYYEEGRRCLEAALQLPSREPAMRDSPFRLRALLALSWVKKSQGDYVGGLAVVEEGLRLARALDDPQSIAFALYLKSIFTFDRMHPEADRGLVEESISICKAIGEKWILGGCLFHLAEITSDSQASYALLEMSAQTYRESGDQLNLTFSLVGLAWSSMARGNPGRAQQYFEECLEISRQFGRNDSTAFATLQLSVLARWQGEYARAQELNEESLAIYLDMGNRQGQAWARCLLAELNHLQGYPGLAIATYQECLEVFPEISDHWKMGWCYEKLGDAFYRLGEYEIATNNLEHSLDLLGQDSETHYPTLILGEIERVRGNLEGAAGYYRQSLAILKETGVPLFVPSRLEALARLAILQDDPERAAWLFGAALAGREKMGTPIPPIDLAEHQELVTLLRRRLEEGELEAAWQEGRTMTLAEATQRVLGC